MGGGAATFQTFKYFPDLGKYSIESYLCVEIFYTHKLEFCH